MKPGTVSRSAGTGVGCTLVLTAREASVTYEHRTVSTIQPRGAPQISDAGIPSTRVGLTAPEASRG